MAALLDSDRPPQIRHHREIGQAGCFRFFECSIDARGAGIAQTAADLTVAALAARRLAREAEIAPYFRGRTVALFSSWSEVNGLAVWDDNGLRPAIQLSGALRGGAADLLSILIRTGEAALDLHGIGLVHGALFPFGLWTDQEFGAFRFADCSLAFAIKTQIKIPAAWALISPPDLVRLSPEQVGAISSRPDERTDCYGLGLVFRSIISRGGDPDYRVPDPLNRLVATMTAREPSSRPPSIAVIVQALRQFRGSLSSRMRFPEAPCETKAGDLGQKLKIRSAGRDDLVNELRQIWSEEQGKAVAIAGPPGIGKTELSRLFTDDLALSGIIAVSGKGDPLRRTQPLLVVRQIVRGLWAQVLLRGVEEAARIGASVRTALGDSAEFFVAVVPEARPMLGFAEESRRLVSVREQHQLAAAVSGFLCGTARACGGLCLVFDDLQWLDENSLRAVEQLVSDAAAVPVMLILISRTSPGAAPPPVISGLRRIDLGPMPVSGIAAILARTFDHRMSGAEDLATQLHTLSGGNPLHVTQILHLMASRGGIYWDVGAEMWKWSGSASSDHAMNEDVLALIAERIAGLDPELRQALRTAAGLAEVFEARELAVVLDRGWAEVEAWLCALAASGLILSAESEGEMMRWRFIHDHVRLAAIHDVPQSERAALRYSIGLKLLSQRDEASLHKHDFVITDCLADFPGDTLDPTTRHRLAQREILVGVDARRRLDFAEAVRHLDRAAKLLPADPWRNARSQCVQITEEQIYCAFARGDGAATGRLFREALDHSPDPLDAVYFYRLQVVIETQAENYAGALLAAARGLSKIGVRMPLSRSSAFAVVALEILHVSFRLGRDPIAKLKTLATSSDPRKYAAIDLIASVLPAAYWAAPELMVAGGLKILSLSLSGGRARSTPLGEVIYALGVSAFLGARRAGFRFGEFAVQRAALDGDPYIENQVLLIHAAFIRFWIASLIDDEPLLRRGYELARKCGDMLFANFHILGLMSHGLARGAPLGELEDLIRWGEDLIRRSRESFSLATIEKWRDVVVALRGPAALRAEVPVTLRPGTGSQRGNQTSECYRRAMLCQFLYFAGDIAGSAAAGQAADRIMWRSPGHLIKVEHAFYYGLALAAAARQTSGASWRAELALRRMIRRLARWAAGGSDTFSARLSLLRAEHASLKRSSLAVPLYEEAIRAAHTSHMLHVAALANEAAARHFIRLGSQTAAQGYAVQARDLFESWGAVGKVRALESEMPELLRRPDETEAVSFARGAADFAGDALLSASDPDELLTILLTIAGRISGADLAVYASVESRVVTINAEARGINEPAQAGLPPEMLDSASPSVLRYAAATGEGLWGNLAADHRFRNCSRLAARRPKAVCCLPVQRSGKILGLLYLEHFANPAAFSFSVVEALKNLTGNLASALENEETNRALRVRNAELTEAARKIALLESAKTQFEKFAPGVVRTEILANPKAPNLDAQPCDVTILFLDIAGYTNMNERLSPEEARALVERCFSRLVDPIYRHGGEVCEWSGDGLMIFFSSGDPCEHAVDAVRSALEMKQECRAMMAEAPPGEPRVVVNFGLNSGLGVVGLTRLEGTRHSRWIYSVNGQVANIAARIVGEAKDGVVLVGPETARRIHGRFNSASAGFRHLKGLTMEVELFLVA